MMCSTGIAWCSFTWEAFATLAAGFMAVFAAFIVGLRQTQILMRQAAIQELAVRSELFDRRYENYETVRDFLQAALSLTSEPDQAARDKFFTAKREARFLFGPEVHDGLDLIWKNCSEMFVASSLVAKGFAPEGYDYQAEVKRKYEYFRKTSAAFDGLHDLYHQLKLDI
ncbi:MAG: hypothetical protein ABJA20_15460 [Novosphingobium sp.]